MYNLTTKFMLTIKKSVLLFTIAVAISTACSKKPEESVAPNIANEELTTVQLAVVNTHAPYDVDTATWQQLIGANGVPLPIDSSKAFLNLHANTTYNVQVLIWDKTQTPPTNVTTEILARENYHLFYFQPTPISPMNLIVSDTTTNIPGTPTSATGPYLNLTVKRTDHDTNVPPLQVGLIDNFYTGDSSTGNLRLVLRHQPNAKNGTYAPGSSDLDVNYHITIY